MLSTEARVRKLQTLLDRIHARGTRLATGPSSAGAAAVSSRGIASPASSSRALPRPHQTPATPATPAPPQAAATAAEVNTVPPPPDATTQPPVAPSVAPAPVHASAPRAALPEPVVTHAKLGASTEVGRFIGSLPENATAADVLAAALLN